MVSGADLPHAGVRAAGLVGVGVQPSPKLRPLDRSGKGQGLLWWAAADEN